MVLFVVCLETTRLVVEGGGRSKDDDQGFDCSRFKLEGVFLLLVKEREGGKEKAREQRRVRFAIGLSRGVSDFESATSRSSSCYTVAAIQNVN